MTSDPNPPDAPIEDGGSGRAAAPPIYREVVRDLRINPFTPIERYRAHMEMALMTIDIARPRFLVRDKWVTISEWRGE